MPCLLHIHGESFEPSSVPELRTLRPYSVYRRGDEHSGGGGFSEAGGVSCEVSSRERPIDMIDDAVAFLTRHHELLHRLAGLDAIRYRKLSIMIYSEEFMENYWDLRLPSLLLRLAGGLDLDLCCSFMVLEARRAVQYPPCRR